MAYSGAVWGIDIGQCGLKALRGHAGEDGVVDADAFEYIEYPKLLSQQDADREELIRDAIKTFLSRNSLKGERIAISVSGVGSGAAHARAARLSRQSSAADRDYSMRFSARQPRPSHR